VLQQRKHEAAKKMMIQKLNDVQRECRDGVQARDVEEKLNVLLKALFHMASALKSTPEMSSATFNAAAIRYFTDGNASKSK
jgi:phage terminase Nu1 subunit (DNA packaging protein)